MTGPAAPDEPTVSLGPVAHSPVGVFRTDRAALGHAAGRREALAEMAAWHKAQEAVCLDNLGPAARAVLPGTHHTAVVRADTHDAAARYAKALAAAADDPAGPLPLRVRCRFHPEGGHVSLLVYAGPAHGGAFLGGLIVRTEDLPAIRGGWPGAAFVEDTPHAPP